MKLVLLGDIALFGNLSLKNNSSLKKYFAEVADYLSSADYVVGNLETPFTIKKEINGVKSAYIYSDDENIEILNYLHLNAVTLANNHIFDYGKEGYELTKFLLTKAGIKNFGTEGNSLKIELGTNKLAFEGFCCYSTNPLNCVPYGRYGVNEFDIGKAQDILLKNAIEGYLNIFSVHTGVEHVNYPSTDSIDVAHLLARKAKYIYYGHHPHVAQGLEFVDGTLIAYSLGNFCFDDVYTLASKDPLIQLSENNRSSFVLEVVIDNNTITSYKTIPIYIGQDNLYVGKGTTSKQIVDYSNAIIAMPKIEYIAKRDKLIGEYIKNRKQKRNLQWYMKRLKFKYVKLILEMKRNKSLYCNAVKKYL